MLVSQFTINFQQAIRWNYLLESQISKNNLNRSSNQSFNIYQLLKSIIDKILCFSDLNITKLEKAESVQLIHCFIWVEEEEFELFQKKLNYLRKIKDTIPYLSFFRFFDQCNQDFSEF
ncbi:hypothetical protein ABPG72_014603 [Tetrahymena utriculariae]